MLYLLVEDSMAAMGESGVLSRSPWMEAQGLLRCVGEMPSLSRAHVPGLGVASPELNLALGVLCVRRSDR